MYVDLVKRYTFDYATPTSCKNNPQNVITLDPDIDEHYLLTAKAVL